jgi:hypothetical protein
MQLESRSVSILQTTSLLPANERAQNAFFQERRVTACRQIKSRQNLLARPDFAGVSSRFTN